MLHWHNIGLRSSLLHGISDDRGYNRCLSGTEDLPELQDCSSHLPEVLLQSIRVGSIDGILCNASLSLLVRNLLRKTLYQLVIEYPYNLLLEGFFDSTTDKLGTQYTILKGSLGLCGRYITLLSRKLWPILPHEEGL